MEIEHLLKIVQTVSDSGLTHFRYEEGDVCLELGRKEKRPVIVEEAAAREEPVRSRQDEKPDGRVVSSPLVGTFYSAPSPEEEPYVRIGDSVKKGQVLGIIEAMKLMNEIESECDGTVQEILAEDEQLVEYGQPLFVIG